MGWFVAIGMSFIIAIIYLSIGELWKRYKIKKLQKENSWLKVKIDLFNNCKDNNDYIDLYSEVKIELEVEKREKYKLLLQEMMERIKIKLYERTHP